MLGSSVSSSTTNEPVSGVATVVSANASLALGVGLELAVAIRLAIRIVALLPITEGCGPPN